MSEPSAYWKHVQDKYQELLALPAGSSQQEKTYVAFRRTLIADGEMLWDEAKDNVNLEEMNYGFLGMLFHLTGWETQVSMLQNLPTVHIHRKLQEQVNLDVHSHAVEDLEIIAQRDDMRSKKLNNKDTLSWLKKQYAPDKNDSRTGNLKDFEWFAHLNYSNRNIRPHVEQEKAIWAQWHQDEVWGKHDFSEDKIFRKQARLVSLKEENFPESLTMEDFPENFWFQLVEVSKWYLTKSFLTRMPEEYLFRYLEGLRGLSQFRKERDVDLILLNPNIADYPKEWLHALTA